jgi:hypothetical protein
MIMQNNTLPKAQRSSQGRSQDSNLDLPSQCPLTDRPKPCLGTIRLCSKINNETSLFLGGNVMKIGRKTPAMVLLLVQMAWGTPQRVGLRKVEVWLSVMMFCSWG